MLFTRRRRFLRAIRRCATSISSSPRAASRGTGRSRTGSRSRTPGRLRRERPHERRRGDDAERRRLPRRRRDAEGARGLRNYGGIDLAKADQVDRYDCDGDGDLRRAGRVRRPLRASSTPARARRRAAAPRVATPSGATAGTRTSTRTEGPAGCHLGGYNLPGTGLWVGDYTIEPENGGVGVFAHEFGHDLGLPDLYDTNAGENGTGFWTLMSSGSWASYAADTIGTAPVHMGAWEKLALGWLDLAAVTAGQDATVRPRPRRERDHAEPVPGASRQPAESTRTTTVVPGRRRRSELLLLRQGRRHRQLDDANARVAARRRPPRSPSARSGTSRPTGTTPTSMPTVGGPGSTCRRSASTTTNPNGQNFGNGITGASAGWTTVTATLPAGTSAYRFRYWTDGAVTRPGFAVGLDPVRLGAVDDATTRRPGRSPASASSPNGQFTETLLPLLPRRVAQLPARRHEPLRRLQLPLRQLAGEAVLRERAADLVPQLRVCRTTTPRAPGCRPDPARSTRIRRRWSCRTARRRGGRAGRSGTRPSALDTHSVTLSQYANRERDADADVHRAAGVELRRLLDDRLLQHGAPLHLGEDGRLGREASTSSAPAPTAPPTASTCTRTERIA